MMNPNLKHNINVGQAFCLSFLQQVVKQAKCLSYICLVMLFMTACSFSPLLSNVRVSPTDITPNADGLADVARFSYRLSRSANLSIFLADSQNQRHYFRQDRRRSAGDYQVDFSGVVDGAMLPNGTYTWTIEALADDGEKYQQHGNIVIINADTVKPELQGFSVYPPIFTPNQDGINDRVTINYYLTKQAQVSVYLLLPAVKGKLETRYPIAEVERKTKPGEPGFHTYDYEGGVDLGADPPPDGTYTVHAEAVDRVGNHTVVTRTLVITEGGVPRADIVSANVDFYNPATGDKIVPLGQTLAFTLTVENFGNVPIRTIGPTSGESYRSNENFNTKGAYESAGVWRIGLDYEGNPSYAYPYRWGIGDGANLEKRVINGQPFYYLLPGQRRVITGSIQILEAPAKRDRVNFWAGLIHEQVGIDTFNDYVDPQPIAIGF